MGQIRSHCHWACCVVGWSFVAFVAAKMPPALPAQPYVSESRLHDRPAWSAFPLDGTDGPIAHASRWATLPPDDEIAATAGTNAGRRKQADDRDEPDEDDGEDNEDEEDDTQVTPIVEELFLGFIVYPQEKDEVQLTFGYFDGIEAVGNTRTAFEIEYGITDRFQIGLEVPVESVEEEEPFNGVRNLGLELYYNFYNDRHSGRAYGVGFEFGLPVDSPSGESRAYVYEPFAVAYQEFRSFALNLSGAVEIEDPLDPDGATETAGELAIGLIGKAPRIVPLLEWSVEIAPGETPVLLAPGLYCRRCCGPVDCAVSFPIGLNDEAPDFAVFFFAVVEFEARAICRRF